MKPEEFFKVLANQNNSTLFSAVNFKRTLELRKKKLDHSWESQNYKFYPSSFKSLAVCPKKLVEEDVHVYPSFEVNTVYRMELGKYLHELIQNDTLNVDPTIMEFVIDDWIESYMEALDIFINKMYKIEAKGCTKKLLYNRPRQLSDMLEKKLKDSWPEIPGYCPETGFSFRSDLTLDRGGYPSICDIKTTAVDPNSWQFKKESLPSPDHELQVRFYRYFFNRDKYYDKPIREVGLAYVNVLMPAHSDAEYEVYRDLGEVEDEEIKELVIKSGEHRKDWMEGKKNTRKCTYSLCKTHKN